MAQGIYDRRYTKTPCKWSLNTTEPNPHTKDHCKPRPKICDSILDTIGNTPIVRINNITKQENISCEILAKCEFLNPGGSAKNRVAARIINDLEASGKLRPGMRIVEATSGNTGFGLGLSAIVKGYSVAVCVMGEIDQDKYNQFLAMGVEVIKTPPEARLDSENGVLGTIEKLEREDPNTIMTGQLYNPSNPLAHYDTTAEEILDQVEGKLDYIVIATGTGGQITGLSRKLKEKIPGIIVIGVDPYGSVTHDPENAVSCPYKVEGIGSPIPLRNCIGEIDQWVVVNDKDSFEYARKLIRYEGLLVGASSGTAMYAAVQIAKRLTSDKRVLVMLTDGVKNYMSQFLNDRWMIQNGFMECKEFPVLAGKTVRNLQLTPCTFLYSNSSIKQTFLLMDHQNINELPVFEENKIIGIASRSFINKKIINGEVNIQDNITKSIIKGIKIFSQDTSLSLLSIWIEDYKYAVIHDGDFIGIAYPHHLATILINS